MPYAITEALAEETGVHIGDGSMNIYARNRHYYTVACHHKDDKEYIETVVIPLVNEAYGKSPKPRNWSQGTYGFRICSREIVRFKHGLLGLPLGKKGNIRIPASIVADPILMRACIRGIADTDGCLNLEWRRGKPYPRLHITSISEPLILQIREFLERDGFRVQYWHHKQRNWQHIHKIAVNGPAMLARWMERIGLHNPKHLRKAVLFQENVL